jgi:hypothetical protein
MKRLRGRIIRFTADLSDDELLQTVNSHATPEDTTHCRKSWIVPNNRKLQRTQSHNYIMHTNVLLLATRKFGKVGKNIRYYNVPAINNFLIDKPRQPALRHYGVLQVEATVLVNVRLAKACRAHKQLSHKLPE